MKAMRVDRKERIGIKTVSGKEDTAKETKLESP